jgi:poly(3-hydroxybutyrate) depolymerase
MISWRVLVLAAAAMLAAAPAAKAEYEVIAQTNVEYAQHDGAKLVADLYQPKGLAKAPAIVAVHGEGGRTAVAPATGFGVRFWPRTAMWS